MATFHATADELWRNKEAALEAEGQQLVTQAQMLNLDAAVLVVQLNVRLLLEVRGLHSIHRGALMCPFAVQLSSC